MQRYNQRMVEQLKARQQQEKARLPKIQRSEGKTRMAMYKKSLHINGAGSAAEQREKVKQVGAVGRGPASGCRSQPRGRPHAALRLRPLPASSHPLRPHSHVPQRPGLL